MTGSEDKRIPLGGVALITLLTVLAYLPSLTGGFVFDDYGLIVNNHVIRAHDGLHRIWFTTEPLDYYPLTWSMWWLEWRLWGNNPTGYHVVSVLLHAVNAVLVWMVLRRLKIPGAWLVGLVFALHPVNVATVAWISEQKNTLSMLFYLVAILFYLRFDTDNRWRWYGLAFAAFLLALLGKTMVVMLPIVLLGCVWWLHGRVRWKDVLLSAPFFVLSLCLGLVTVWFQHHRALAGVAVRTDSVAARLAAAGWVPWFYLYKALLPINLALIYPKWNVDGSSWVSYLPGVILAGSFVGFWRNRKTWGRPLLFGLGYFVIMLFPVLGFFDQGFYRYSLVADHWQYYAIVGILALLVAAGARACCRLGTRADAVGAWASMVLLAALGLATWVRCGVYQSEETLWRDAVTRNPETWLGYNNLGCALQKMGRLDDAIPCYEQALRIKPSYAEAHYNLADALAQSGKLRDAISQYQQAVQITPDYIKARNGLGIVLAQTGRIPEAIEQFNLALKTKPDYAEAHRNLAITLVRAGRMQEAIGHWQRLLQLKSADAEAHYFLGLALWQAGEIHEAIGHYEQALRIQPDHPETLNNLAWLLATLRPADGGDPARAVTLAQRACELTGNQRPDYLDTLAVAYAAVGRFNDAISTAQHAIELARSAGLPELAKKIRAHLDLYRAGQRFLAPIARQ